MTAGPQRAEQQRRPAPRRPACPRPSSATVMPSKPMPASMSVVTSCAGAEDLRRARQAGQRPGQDHHQDVVRAASTCPRCGRRPGWRRPRAARSRSCCGPAATRPRRPPRARAASPRLTRMLDAEQRRQFGVRARSCATGRLVVRRRLEAVLRQQVAEQVERDVVEHDRRDDLVGTGAGLEQADQAAADAPADQPGEDADDQVQHDRQVPGEADLAGEDRAARSSGPGADVEQAGPERQRRPTGRSGSAASR